jgi:hypothetical protein
MSSSLDSATKSALAKSLGTMCTPLYMTMAKLYLCAPNESAWRDTGIWGACGVILDRNPPISRFIRIFEVESGSFECRFSEEIRVYMQYNVPSSQFHTFEGDSAIIGLSFESEKEAGDFMGFVRKMIGQAAVEAKNQSALGAPKAAPQKKKSGFFSKLFGKSEGPQQIGLPTDVQHKQHIGYDANQGFDCTDVPPEWASIFKNAGIKKKHLKNPAAAKVIYETLQNELGRENYQRKNLPPAPTPPVRLVKLNSTSYCDLTNSICLFVLFSEFTSSWSSTSFIRSSSSNFSRSSPSFSCSSSSICSSFTNFSAFIFFCFSLSFSLSFFLLF